MKKLTIAVLILGFIACQQHHPVQFWPENGSIIQNITWEIPVEDSSLVLQQNEGHWILPQPGDSAAPKLSTARHSDLTTNPYQIFFNRVSQQVVHDSGGVSREFYRFSDHGVLLLGSESPDSTQLITIYEPPLVLIPIDLQNLDTTFFYEGTPKVWHATADSFRQQQTTRLRLTRKQTGTVLLDSVAVPALLVQMTLSMDGTVGYAGTDLIVPDAIMMKSNLLMIEKQGPVLEWGIRSRPKGGVETADRDSDLEMENRERVEERERYIEVTLHQTAN